MMNRFAAFVLNILILLCIVAPAHAQGNIAGQWLASLLDEDGAPLREELGHSFSQAYLIRQEPTRAQGLPAVRLGLQPLQFKFLNLPKSPLLITAPISLATMALLMPIQPR